MPDSIRKQTVYVQTGNPDTVNETTPYFAGQIGQSYDLNDRAYQYVQVDSGATSSLSAGAPAATKLAYWKDRSQYLVTTDSRFGLLGGAANSFRNNVAGVFMGSITPGNYGFILQRGRAISVKEAGSATGGMVLISDTSTTACQGLGVAINTAPNCVQLGVVRTATSGSTCTADIDIATIP